jgi:nitrite reductase/ring-hydroxylating ferredoxin subunit
MQHMIINVSALVACGLGWAFRDRATLLPGDGTLLLEAAAVGLVSWGGWLGGTLVYRNQIGVDHRFARAGKWKEQAFEARPGESIAVAREDELEIAQMKLVRLGDRRIVLARTERGYVAFDDRCTHKGGPLSDGALICGTVQCPWHGSQFDVHTGAVKAGPAGERIATYPVEVRGGELRLMLPRG